MSVHGRKIGAVPKEDHTKVRSLRSDPSVWDPFGEYVGQRRRSAWLNSFMGWVNSNPELWLAASDRLGDQLGPVLAQFLAWHERQPGAGLPKRPDAPSE